MVVATTIPDDYAAIFVLVYIVLAIFLIIVLAPRKKFRSGK